ncbi:MAG TPA: hypothetical protein PLY93_02895 [Turneriella sp.]|nr:hypothetical protein [Turneriella sp.]
MLSLFVLFCSCYLSLLTTHLSAQTPEAVKEEIIYYLDNALYHYERRRFLNTLDNLRLVLDLLEKTKDERVLKLTAETLAAETLKNLGREEEAVNMYERALAHGLNNNAANAYLALYFDRHKDFKRALGHFEKYFENDKKDVSTHIRYAALLGRLKKREQAKKVLAEIDATPSPQKVSDCKTLEIKKKWRNAVTCFEVIRQALPASEEGYLGLYRAARVLRDKALFQQNAELLYFIFGNETRYIWPLVEYNISQKEFYEARLLLEEIILLRGKDSEAERILANLKIDAEKAIKKPFRASDKELEFYEEMRKNNYLR